MNDPRKPEDAPGHYGAGYGEQVTEGAAPQPAPLTDADPPLILDSDGAGSSLDADEAVITETVIEVGAPGEIAPSSAGDAGTPVVFTPDDVHLRPPDRTPTDEAPESEKVSLIFERS